MNITKIEIRSNSNPDSIKNDLEEHKSSLKLQISLEVEINQEENILSSIVESLQSFTHLEELYIIIAKQCILEQFHILTEGFAQLFNLKIFSITFEQQCFAGEIHFKHLLSALKRMTHLTDLRICIESNNELNLKTTLLINELLNSLNGLLKFKIQIQEGNQFDDQTVEELAKGFQNTLLLEELEFSLDFTYITEKGMVALSNLLLSLNKTLQKLKIIFEGKCKYYGQSKIFEVLPFLSKLKAVSFESLYQVNIDEREMKIIVESFSKLTDLESLSLKKILSQKYVNDSIQIIKYLQHFEILKNLDLEILNFNEITQEYFIILQDSFRSLKNLEQLKLKISDSTPFENESIRSLANSFEKLNRLTSLELIFQCKVNIMESVHLMESLKHLTNILSLKLYFCTDFILEEEVLDYLGESLRYLTNLRQLHLILTNFDNKPIQYLIKQPQWLNCYLYFNRNNLRKKKSFNLPNLNLSHLNNLEELILKNNEKKEILGQELFTLLECLEKLKILEMTCNIDMSETVHSFSSAFIKLNQLTDLNLSMRINNSILKNEQLILFQSFRSLSSLKNLTLSFDEIVTLEQSESLGQSLLFLTNITTFLLQLKKTFQELECLRSILDGFINSKLKTFQLKANLPISFISDQKDLKLFSSVKYLENISLEQVKLQLLIGQKYEILIDSLKELKQLRKIEMVVSCEHSSFVKNKLVGLLHCFPNLIGFQIKEKNDRSEFLLSGFEQLKEFDKKLKIRDIQLLSSIDHTPKSKAILLMEQLQNLRSLSLQINKNDLSINHNQQAPLLNKTSRFLTQLQFSLNQNFLDNYFTNNNLLAGEFRSIKQFQYLTDLSVDLKQQQITSEADMIIFGQSLQEIHQIKNLELIVNIKGRSTPQQVVELSKGIQQQKYLRTLSVEIKNIFQETEQSNHIITIIESIQHLAYLTNFKLIFHDMPSFSFSKIKHYPKNEILLGLAKSLSCIQHLRELYICFSYEQLEEMNEGLSSFANVFEQNTSLVSLKIEVKGYIINDYASQQFGQGLSCLKQLQECEILFEKSQINNSSGFLSGINSLDYLRYFKLVCDVNSFSFFPLDLILKQKIGKYTFTQQETFILNEFREKFSSSEIEITIIQRSRSKMPESEVLSQVKHMTTFSSKIIITMELKNIYFTNEQDYYLVFEQLAPLSIFSLQLQIDENNSNFFQYANFQMRHIQQLQLDFSSNLNNDQILNLLNSLSKQMGNISQLNLHLQKNFVYDPTKIKYFLSTIIKFSSVLNLNLQIDSDYFEQQAYLYRSLQRKHISLINLQINDYYVEFSDDSEKWFFPLE